jgi:hypothetical protein
MHRFLTLCLVGSGISIMLMGVAVLATGLTLGLFFAGLLLAALLVPYLALSGPTLNRQILLAVCVVNAIALIWLLAILLDNTGGLAQWLWAYGILLAAAATQLGLARCLRRVHLPQLTSAALTVLLGLLWLSSPIWLFHHLETPAQLPWMQRLIDVHPLFALNAAIPWSVWTEAPQAYQILNLNQDVFYAMPASPLPAIAVHSLLAGTLILLTGRASTATGL